MEEGYVLQGGNGVRITPLEATEDGTYNAKEGQAFNPVTVKAGGGSGGGVLVVSADLETMTLDKTWQEIFDADYPVITVLTGENDKVFLLITEVLVDTEFEPATYLVNAGIVGNNSQFIADSADGYPVLRQNGGD